MRITFFYFFLRDGGVEKNLVKIANSFASGTGHDIDFTAMALKGHFLNALDSRIKLTDLALTPFKLIDHFKCIVLLARHIRQQKPDVIITGMTAANITVILAKLLSGSGKKTRVIISEHGPTLMWLRNRKNRLPVKLLLRFLIMIFYQYADHVLVVSDFLIPDLSQAAHIPESRIKRIYNPVVDNELFEEAKATAGHPWFEKNGFPVVLTAGRLAKEKNFSLLLRAFALAHEARSDLRLVILGDGPERQNLEDLVTSLGIKAAVSLPGFCSNPYAFMSHAAAFILSSNYEGLPTVLIEALACGCPVVSTACPGGASEILGNGKYGLLVPVGDVDALKVAIMEVANHPSEAKKRVADFQKNKMHEFSMDNVIKQYVRLVENG